MLKNAKRGTTKLFGFICVTISSAFVITSNLIFIRRKSFHSSEFRKCHLLAVFVHWVGTFFNHIWHKLTKQLEKQFWESRRFIRTFVWINFWFCRSLTWLNVVNATMKKGIPRCIPWMFFRPFGVKLVRLSERRCRRIQFGLLLVIWWRSGALIHRVSCGVPYCLPRLSLYIRCKDEIFLKLNLCFFRSIQAKGFKRYAIESRC